MDVEVFYSYSYIGQKQEKSALRLEMHLVSVEYI
ncbi:hypothetical protein J2Y40_000379 [Chryseobacterium sp. 2987]|nr:hypothetical protein [Chryseobacterium sp. 2987]